MQFRFGEFCVDEDLQELGCNGRRIALEPRPLALLLYLIKHRDRVVSKDELLDRLWLGDSVSDSSLQRAMSIVRAALGDRDASIIRTYSKRGYRFCAEVDLPDPRRSPHDD